MVMKFRKGNVPGVGLMKGNGTSVISGKSRLVKYYLGGGVKYFLMFTPNFGEGSHFD